MDTIGLQDIQNLARQESVRLHHYFIGVEHLFIALTQLQGGLTLAVLEHHGVSPRFVRYSIRESIGRYEDRRYWPGFPETPRALQVLALARRYAGIHPPTERDLLLAILDEGDSVVIRVLHEMGVDVAMLRRTAANWTQPLAPQRPEVPIEGNVELDFDQRSVLKQMFRDYGAVRIVHELQGGYSGARVLLVRPIRVDGYKDAPVVVKLDDRQAVLYERRRYDLHVKGTLPITTARLLEQPVVPDESWCGGLKYSFVGGLDDTEPISLREVATKRDPQEVSELLQSLFDVFGPAWWLQRKPYRFGVWREYEHVLPPALVLEALPDRSLDSTSHVLNPLGAWSRANHVMPGEVVALNNFVVQKTDAARRMVHLAAGAQPEAINRTGKVEVRGLVVDENSPYFRGEMVGQIVGRVISTRDDLLKRSLQVLEPDFDLRLEKIPSGHDHVKDLPNPLLKIPELLERQVNGYLSAIHGDLHLGNVLVGPGGSAWLIDFAWAREGHTLFDWALLEISLLSEMIAPLAPPGWAGAWGTIALLHSINQGEDRVFRERHQVARALTVVATVREIVRQCLVEADRMTEYYVALALLALRVLDWKSITVDGRRLGFLVSALSISEIKHFSATTTMTDTRGTWQETTTGLDPSDLWKED